MHEINRSRRKGNLTAEYQEKLRQRHNVAAAKVCLSIDQVVLQFLGLSKSDQRFIAGTLRDIDVTDFGLFDELEDVADKPSS
jgi:hypothetical protein